MDGARNSIAAAQIRTGHWRPAIYLKRVKKKGQTTTAGSVKGEPP
jgi:hypothetical protein